MEESTKDDCIDSGEVDKLIRKSIPNDLKKKVLRHVSESFFEDSLRALRLARFYSKFSDFQIHPSTKKILQKISQLLVILRY